MSKVIKAEVINGRYKGEIVRVTNVTVDELGRKFAACFLADGSRANILASDLKLIEEKPEPEIIRPKTSMPFVSGSIGSRTMNQARSIANPRETAKAPVAPKKEVLVKCEICGMEYNQEERKGRPGKITQCENCAGTHS